MIMLFGYGCEPIKDETDINFSCSFLYIIYVNETLKMNIELYNSKSRLEDIITTRFEFSSTAPNSLFVDEYGYLYGLKEDSNIYIIIELYDSPNEETRKVIQIKYLKAVVQKYDNKLASMKIDKENNVITSLSTERIRKRLGFSDDAISQNALDYDWFIDDANIGYISDYGGLVLKKTGITKIRAIYKYDPTIIYESELCVYYIW